MTEETRAAYWAKIEEIDQKIEALKEERDAIHMLPEDISPLYALAIDNFKRTNAILASLAIDEAKADASTNRP